MSIVRGETPNTAKFCRAATVVCEISRGGFRHVRPNRGLHKRGPHKRTGKFLQHSNMSEIIEIIIRKQFCVARWHYKVSSQVLTELVIDISHTALLTDVMPVLNKMSMMTTPSLCVSCEFSPAVGIFANVWRSGIGRFFPATICLPVNKRRN